jgi:hypothetical protein
MKRTIYQMLIWTNGGRYGWMLGLEIDFDFADGPRARAWRLPVSDFGASESAQHAASGMIELAKEPTPELLKVAGRFDVSFDDGPRVQGQFTDER